VYAVERDGDELALKVPHPDHPLGDRERQRFLEEARLMGRVRNPAIVEVIDAALLDDRTPYVAMPRLCGRTLAELIARCGPLPLDHALDLFGQLADATAMLHEAGLLHRDLKAENVFLVDDDTGVKLLDFGIAKDVSSPSLTTTGMVRGTPATMAPERLVGKDASEASDVYELALVLYVMLAGRLPWPDDLHDVTERLSPATLVSRGVRVPASLSTVVARALSSHPADRPPSVRALRDQVENAALSEPRVGANHTVTSEHLRPLVPNVTPLDATVPSSRQKTTLWRVPRQQRQRRTMLAAGAFAIVSLVVVAVALTRGDGHDDTRAPSLAKSAPVNAPAGEEPREEPTAPASAEQPAPSTEKAEPPRRSQPAAASASATPSAKPSASAAGSSRPSIPGGVYETPPYR
jgi:serine/threonine-protein kinase